MERVSNEQQFLELYEGQADAVFRHCFFKVSDRELARDLTQEAFMKTWKALAEGQVLENPKAFLFRVAGNLVIDHYRRKKEVSLDVLQEAGFDPSNDDYEAILVHADVEHVQGVLMQLEETHREIIVLRYVNDLSIAEIAESLQESENVVSVRIHRAVQKLKEILHTADPKNI